MRGAMDDGERMSSGLNRFLGDTPLRTAIKLVVVSFVVGIVMAALDLSVLDVLDAIRDFFIRIWNMGFEAVERFARYFLLGAAVVVPAFLILRLMRYRR
jgi:hypothetical protein